MIPAHTNFGDNLNGMVKREAVKCIGVLSIDDQNEVELCKLGVSNVATEDIKRF